MKKKNIINEKKDLKDLKFLNKRQEKRRKKEITMQPI